MVLGSRTTCTSKLWLGGGESEVELMLLNQAAKGVYRLREGDA